MIHGDTFAAVRILLSQSRKSRKSHSSKLLNLNPEPETKELGLFKLYYFSFFNSSFNLLVILRVGKQLQALTVAAFRLIPLNRVNRFWMVGESPLAASHLFNMFYLHAGGALARKFTVLLKILQLYPSIQTQTDF